MKRSRTCCSMQAASIPSRTTRACLVFDPTKPGGWQELTPAQVQARVASRGEIVRVLSAVGIAQPLFRQPAMVTVSGEVAKPGRYYVQPGTPVASVIAQAGGLTSQAFPYATVFTRESVRRTQQQSYERAMRDLELLLTTQPLVSASQTEQIQPARLAAVQSVVGQLEARKPDGRLVLNVEPADRTLPSDMIVENNDAIYVPPQPVTVGVFGAVPKPRLVPVSRRMRRSATICAAPVASRSSVTSPGFSWSAPTAPCWRRVAGPSEGQYPQADAPIRATDLRACQRLPRRVLGPSSRHFLGVAPGSRHGRGGREMTIVQDTVVWVQRHAQPPLGLSRVCDRFRCPDLLPATLFGAGQDRAAGYQRSAASTTSLLGALGGGTRRASAAC